MVTLREMKQAVTSYFQTKVQSLVTITPPSGGSVISPGENFNVKLTVTNAVADPSQGVVVTDIIYHVRVNDPTKAKLIVPPAAVGVARPNSNPATPALGVGTQVNEMFITPATDRILSIGDSDLLLLTGRALAVGSPKVIFNIIGDVDLELINRSNLSVSVSVPIVT